MKTKLLLSISLFLFVGNCWGQITFQRVFRAGGGCAANNVKQTTDGGYIIVGNIAAYDTDYNYIYLIKTNEEGDTLWTKTFGGIYGGGGFAVQQTIDGGYIIAGGVSDSSQAGHLSVIKTDAAGDTLWTKAYGGTGSEGANFIEQTSDSGYIITGSTTSFGVGSMDVYLLKINATGDITWTKTFGGETQSEGCCVKQTYDNGYIICGWTSINENVYLIKTNSYGDSLWTKTYGGINTDWGTSILLTTDSGYLIIASIMNSVAHVYLFKTNANGDTLWTKTYGGSSTDVGNDVQLTSDSGYIICGYSYSFGAGNSNVYLIKINSIGDTLWTKTYGGFANDYGASVMQTNDGGYIIAGRTESFVPLEEGNGIYLIKTDANGNSGCHEGNTNTAVRFTPIQVAGTNTIVASGGTAIPITITIGSGGDDSAFCLTTGINELTLNNTITLYPNPATDQVVITGNWKENKTLLLTIYNIAGEKIYNETVNRKQETVNCKLLSSGVYFITVADENEQWVGRFVKE